MFEDNVRCIGGHYWEMADLLAQGAQQHGYETHIAVNLKWSRRSHGHFHEIYPVFDVRRMNHWSIGDGGNSTTQRDRRGKPIGATRRERLSQHLRDRLSRADRNPAGMLRRWSDSFLRAFKQWQPRQHDHILINTCDDFVMLALADAIESLGPIEPLQLSLLFHFPLTISANNDQPSDRYGRQVLECMDRMHPHRIRLCATTDALASQMRANGLPTSTAPYPTRAGRARSRCSRDLLTSSPSQRLRIVMAGMPRPEKGRRNLRGLLTKLHSDPTCRNECCISLQLPTKRWKRLIPSELHSLIAHQRDPQTTMPGAGSANAAGHFIEVKEDKLSTSAYHDWIDSSDIALFLYEPERYTARCSGVLLEMMIRGVPVLVPGRCWLADQVAAAGPQQVGMLFDHVDQVPERLAQIRNRYADFSAGARQYASNVAKEHSPSRAVHQLGLREPEPSSGERFRHEMLKRLAS
ncbi:MAG: hypothetical protein AAGJ40_12390 [Planctomycetota bacterium]